MSYFETDSLFAREAYVRRKAIEVPVVPEATLEPKVGKTSSHMEHWHHDLTTIDILLDQSPPDVDRARRMVQEIAEEMYRELR